MFHKPFSKKSSKNFRPPAPRKNTKLTGERSEAAFLNRAAGLGFGVAKPWGDSLRYDFILDNGSRLWRVQVKCTESIRARAYETRTTYTTGKGRAAYTRADIDFLAAHVVPLDIWYILPVEVCTPAPMLRFYPHREAKKMRLEPYREAWHLLQSPADADPDRIEIQASADETVYAEDVLVGNARDVRNVGAPAPESAYVGTAGAASAHVGTAALGCPAGQSPAATTELSNLTWLTPRPTKPVIPSEAR